MAILLTGGAGYIGSHTLVELLNDGYDAIIMDNFSNSSPKAIERVEQLTGKKVKWYNADISNRDDLEKIFSENDIHEVINFASLKAVGESVAKPWEY
ncbi:MAG: GDP-mannose 4,6-dehydratase [Lachnospiraceae bacterium]|nr:GDP-mannose 4,6-dehydratase [Lachnospiraceae bacterium]